MVLSSIPRIIEETDLAWAELWRILYVERNRMARESGGGKSDSV
jgi:hypothetical protein